MNKLKMMISATALLMLVSLSAFAAPQTLKGVLTDSMCTKKHMMSGSAAECTRACVRAGAKYVLVSGGKVYVLQGDAKKFYDLAGQNVTVTGEVKGDNLEVKNITVGK